MKSRTAVLISLATIMVLGLAGTVAAAGFGGFRGGMNEPGAMPRMMETQDLSEEQATQIAAIESAAYSKMRDLRIELMDRTHELRNLLFLKADEGLVLAKRAEIEHIQAALKAIQEETRGQVNALLTEEQLALHREGAFGASAKRARPGMKAFTR